MSRAVALCLALLAGAAAAEEALRLRQEYNQVAAALDSLVRQHGGAELARLAEMAPQDLVPPGMEPVLLFWADDEAEIWLNGLRVGQTRLTPTRIVIPSLYLGDHNLLQVHAWDTDRVESGLMAGLYLEDPQGQLHPVLVTQAQGWRASSGPAREVYYLHSQPDIPGARIIWGAQLFGEVWLEGEFSGNHLQRAAATGPLPGPAAPLEEHSMIDHQLLGRMVSLQAQRRELARSLEAFQTREDHLPWAGHRALGLSLTLGRAAPLEEGQTAAMARRLHHWVRALPLRQQPLFLPEARPLKGTPTPALPLDPAEAREDRADRRAEYQPPPERGIGPATARVRSGRPGGGRPPRDEWQWWLLSGGLAVYVGAAGFRWWRLFNEVDRGGCR